MKTAIVICLCLVLWSCVPAKPFIHSSSKLQFLNEYSIPLKTQFRGTTIGGFSGIDYDVTETKYYIISDDGSKINPARYYEANFYIGNNRIDSVEFLNVTTLLKKNDSVFSYSSVDPEAIRFHPGIKKLFWSSEGEKIFRKGDTILHQPSINISEVNGKLFRQFRLPASLYVQKNEKGSRSNGSLEGISFSNDLKYLYASIEEPLYEDGPKAGIGDSSAWVRIIQFDIKKGVAVKQFAYQLDAVAYPPVPTNGFKINGVSEILCIGKKQLLVIERSFSTGLLGCVIKIYLADLSYATDITQNTSLQADPSFKPVSKKLLVNMETIGIPVYNVEGITFGPLLPNGNRSVIFVADDNFSATDKTQFLLFEIQN